MKIEIIDNPTQEEQNKFLLTHINYIPKDYKYIKSGSMIMNYNENTEQLWIHTIDKVNGKTKDGSSFCQSYTKGEK